MQTLPEDIGLLLAGDGSVRTKLQALVKKLGLSQRVFFLGHVQDMKSFYRLLDVFCLSSNNEGLPLAPLEAQACNVPVVLTDVGGCKEAVCHESGELVEPNNPTKLSAALWRLLSEKVDIAPRDFIERERSIKNMISRYVALTQPSLRERL
jgi:glycosyltransferase involved in cell wall biosynthesis